MEILTSVMWSNCLQSFNGNVNSKCVKKISTSLLGLVKVRGSYYILILNTLDILYRMREIVLEQTKNVLA